MKTQTKAVALVGKLGHGKTCLLNKLTGTTFLSTMSPRSCTEHIQFGYTHTEDILVIDTPGFYSSDDVAKHIAAQKLALEGIPLSGVYIVVKVDRADGIAEEVSKIMTFIGSDDLRVIVTHADTVQEQTGYNSEALLAALSKLLGLVPRNIFVTGKSSPTGDLERFIESTLHDPKSFKITPEQIASISSLHVVNRKLNKPIEEVFSKIAAASKACQEMVKNGKSYEADIAIHTTQSATAQMVEGEKAQIFGFADCLANTALSEDEKHVLYGKAGLALSLRLRNFIDSTNKLLSWDVTNPSDPRNVYRKCNYCGAVFNKTEGCDGGTICGAVPGKAIRPRVQLLAEFERVGTIWTMQYFWDGNKLLIDCVPTRLKEFYAKCTTLRSSATDHVKREGAVFESGCGAQISWSTMLPIEPELLHVLGAVEIQRAGPRERAAKALFEESLNNHEKANKQILQGALP